MARYEVRLLGEQAKLGEVPAADVGKLLVGVQRAIARAAAVSLGRPAKRTGRWERDIEDATRLRLAELRSGSVVAEFEMPYSVPSDEELPFDVATLGDKGWGAAMAAMTDPEHAEYSLVARLAQLADDLSIGDRYTAVEFGIAGAQLADRVKIDRSVRERLRHVVREQQQRPSPPSAITGILIEADFEKKTAHVRTGTQDLVELVFDDDLADDVYEALRQRSQFVGDVTYEPVTNSIKSVQLRLVTRVEQLLLGYDTEAFWRERSADELVAEQRKGPVMSFEALSDNSLSDEDFANFVASFE